MNFNRHAAAAFAPHWICHQHFLAGNLGAAAAHETLDRIDGFGWLDHANAIGGPPDDRPGAGFREVNDRWRQPLAVGIGNDIGDAGIDRRDQRVGGSQINADYSHFRYFSRGGWSSSLISGLSMFSGVAS